MVGKLFHTPTTNNMTTKMAYEFFQIQQDTTLSCSQKLDEIQDLVQNIGHPPPAGLYYVSDIFEDCVNQEHTKCLETAYLTSKEGNILATSDLGRGLEAIGAHDINAVNQFIDQKIQGQNLWKAHYLAPIAPHLYRGQENEMAQQMPDWYQTYSYFFFRALKRTVEAFLEDRRSKGDFDSELQVIETELENITQTEGMDPSDAYLGRHRHDRLLKVSLLLDDLEWVSKNNINWIKVQNNLSQYTHLENLLDENDSAIDNLSDHNTHPLTKLLRYDHSKQSAQSILDDDDSSLEDRREAKASLGKIQKLAYYDHCLEPIAGNGQHDDPIGTFRRKLLGRPEYDSTIPEIEAINVLRREFGTSNVDIEKPAPGGQEPDVHITTSNHTIWGDVTIPRPQTSYQVARRYSMGTNPQDTDYWPEKAYIQKQILNKVRDQIEPVKEDTDDLTMLILKNEDSKVDKDTFRNYILGRLGLAIPEKDDAEPVVVRGETGLEYDEITDHLDIIVLFDTLNDLSGPPYIEGQVANLTDVDQNIIDQLTNAFNAEELTPP